MSDLINPRLVQLDAPLGDDKHDVIRALARIAADAGRTGDPTGLADDALAREATSATGLPGGIAIPHCRTPHVDVPTLVFARLSPTVDFGAKDGPADLAFLIAAPAGGDNTHLQLLTQLARALVRKDFTDALRGAVSKAEVVNLIGEVVQAPAPRATAAKGGADTTTTAQPAAQPTTQPIDQQAAQPSAATPADPAAARPAATTATRRRLVAVTSCPTGIAHTYMAAESLEAAAARAGADLVVETQGSAGSTPIPQRVIDEADAVIFAADLGVKDRGRFAGKPLVAGGVKRGIDDPDGMVATALAYADDPAAPRVEGAAAAAAGGHAQGDESWGLKIRRVLMTGVSYMIPFVAAGGLLIALSFLLGGFDITEAAGDITANNSIFNLPDLEELGLEHALFDSALMAYLGAVMLTLGGAAFSFLVPALAGYIAYAIADRPGIAPGFVMGAIAGTIQSGFLGGIVGGVLAGVTAKWISSWRTPSWARGLMPVVVIPLLATLISGLVMVVVLGKPLTALMEALDNGLRSMSSGGAGIVLGVVLGLMMAFDMGGPLNKTAYLFATAGIGAAATATGAPPELKIMAAVMLAGMVPPLALALATVVRPRLFDEVERENGKAAWLLGASFITEGAIPFAASDPLRVIPSIMAGSAVTGAIAMSADVTLRAPHGGIFVLFAVDQVLWFGVALVAGTLVAAGLVVALKSLTQSQEEIADVAEFAA